MFTIVFLLASDVGSSELWGAVCAMVLAVAGGITGGGAFLKKHFERRDASGEKFLSEVVADNKSAREDDREERRKRDETHRVDLRKRDEALEHSRIAFTNALTEHDGRYMNAIRDVEIDCSKERALDREQRIEDRKMIERIAGIDSGKWRVGDKERRGHPHTRASDDPNERRGE